MRAKWRAARGRARLLTSLALSRKKSVRMKSASRALIGRESSSDFVRARGLKNPRFERADATREMARGPAATKYLTSSQRLSALATTRHSSLGRGPSASATLHWRARSAMTSALVSPRPGIGALVVCAATHARASLGDARALGGEGSAHRPRTRRWVAPWVVLCAEGCSSARSVPSWADNSAPTSGPIVSALVRRRRRSASKASPLRWCAWWRSARRA